MIRYEQWPPRQTGGQIAGIGPQGVRGVHEIDGNPTGIEACCMFHRSQHKNKRGGTPLRTAPRNTHMDREKLIALAERAQEASGPDRGLDAEIELAVGNWHPEHYEAWFRFQECGEAVNPPFTRPVDPRWLTSSLDAAMSLLPANPWVEIKGPREYLNIPAPVPNYWSASVARWNHDGDGMGWGVTPALALTAACLRALAEGEGE